MRKEVSMNTSQMLALVARIESLSAEKALSNEENHKLCVQVIGLHESLDDMRREIKALNEDLLHERSVSKVLSEELSKLKILISADPVTVQLPKLEDHHRLNIKIPLIKFVRQYALPPSGSEKLDLKEAKDAVDLMRKVIFPAAIIPDYEKMIAGLS